MLTGILLFALIPHRMTHGMLLRTFCTWLLIALSHAWNTLLAVYEYDMVGATLAIYLSVPPDKKQLWRLLKANPDNTRDRIKYRECAHEWRRLIAQQEISAEDKIMSANNHGAFYNKRISNRNSITVINDSSGTRSLHIRLLRFGGTRGRWRHQSSAAANSEQNVERKRKCTRNVQSRAVCALSLIHISEPTRPY